MANRRQTVEPEPPAQPETPNAETQTELVPVTSVSSLFARAINTKNPVKGLALKRTLTRPLLAMAHLKRLLFECTSDMYTTVMATKARGGKPGTIRVIDGVDLENGEECTLIANEMMVGALRRGQFSVINVKMEDGKDDVYTASEGLSLIGHAFAFKAGNINEEKGYRHVDVVEIQVER